MNGTLYTIGHSNIQLDDFLKILMAAGIEVAVDVRSIPYSEYAPWFNRDKLESAISSKNIIYLYLGDLLGGKPKDEGCYTDGKPDYSLIRERDFYQKGIERLTNGVKKYRVAIICSEEEPFECHRRNLIGFDMYKNGVKIIHIRHNRVLQEDDFEKEMLSELQGSLFGDI